MTVKELTGLISSLPTAAKHRALRWQLCQIARVAGNAVAQMVKAAAWLIVWHAVTVAGYVVYKAREALRWRR